MVSSEAKTVSQYLKSLPRDRRDAVTVVREVIREHLPHGFEEGMQYGMIGYYIPLSRYPDTYNGQPLAIASLASQKNYLSLYLMGVYSDAKLKRWFERAFKKAGKKLDMGKSCVRFRTAEELPLDVIGEAISTVGVERFIEVYDAARGGAKRAAKKKRKKNKKKPAEKKPAKKKPAKKKRTSKKRSTRGPATRRR